MHDCLIYLILATIQWKVVYYGIFTSNQVWSIFQAAFLSTHHVRVPSALLKGCFHKNQFVVTTLVLKLVGTRKLRSFCWVSSSLGFAVGLSLSSAGRGFQCCCSASIADACLLPLILHFVVIIMAYSLLIQVLNTKFYHLLIWSEFRSFVRLKFILMLSPWVEFDVPTFKVSEISPAGPLGFPGDYFASERQGRVSLFKFGVQWQCCLIMALSFRFTSFRGTFSKQIRLTVIPTVSGNVLENNKIARFFLSVTLDFPSTFSHSWWEISSYLRPMGMAVVFPPSSHS